MPISFITLGLLTSVVASMAYPDSSAPYLLSGILLSVSIYFYYTIIRVFVGLSYVRFGPADNLVGLWQTRSVEYVSLLALYSMGFTNTLYFTLPSVLMMTVIDVFASLVALNIISIEFPDDDRPNGEDDGDS